MQQPENSDLRIVIIGAGMAGILTAIKCREAGFNNFVIYEKARRDRRNLAGKYLSRHRLRCASSSL